MIMTINYGFLTAALLNGVVFFVLGTWFGRLWTRRSIVRWLDRLDVSWKTYYNDAGAVASVSIAPSSGGHWGPMTI
jgi:hypothetical protein